MSFQNNKMASETLPHYVRSHRKRLGLSQAELARLMGAESGASVSRYERYVCEPSLRAVLACGIIFRAPPEEVFAGIFEAVQMVTYRQTRELIGELERAGSKAPAKIEALRTIVESRDTHQNRRHG